MLANVATRTGNSNAIQFWNSRVLLWNTSVPNSFTPGPPFQTTAEACRELNYSANKGELNCCSIFPVWEIFANIFISLTIIFLSKVFWFSPGRVAELSQLIRCARPQGRQSHTVSGDFQDIGHQMCIVTLLNFSDKIWKENGSRILNMW